MGRVRENKGSHSTLDGAGKGRAPDREACRAEAVSQENLFTAARLPDL